ncbi:hypothetical protein EG240_07895 [Paenimyroides tangerinum]|uniref:Uncharacterized protein n=1 Tax=Paenimyroides tangerinum TaxID=2488728 RepID=A0A3P3WAF0_9FLAO|nr:hypothetical protein [Paenimyroides tangerinum]RRJ90936.1 hypothetical protein EG240_07895 [Paenimyroides tangerinum]
MFLTIKAPNFINSRIYKVDTKDYKSFYVFYSNVDISVYDDTFELAKSYKKGSRNQTEILNIIKDDFVYSKQLSQEMYEDIRSVFVDGYSVFNFDGLPVFKLKGNFEILKKDWRFIIIQDKITDKNTPFISILKRIRCRFQKMNKIN